jgi:hypothetical protein
MRSRHRRHDERATAVPALPLRHADAGHPTMYEQSRHQSHYNVTEPPLPRNRRDDRWNSGRVSSAFYFRVREV